MADLKRSQSTANDNDPRSLVRIVPYSQRFLNGASESMNVNGSVTPVNFTVAPPSGTKYYATKVGIFLEDGADPTAKEFGNLAPLTNGFQLIYTHDSTEYVISNMRYNIDLILTFSENPQIGVDKGWFNNPDNYKGLLTFTAPLLLDGTLGDSISFRVRDNLTGIQYLEARAHYFTALDP